MAPFSEEDMRLPDDVRGIWGLIVRLMLFVNACLNPQILTNTGRNFLSFSDSNLTLELDQSGTDGTAAALTPWQPYAAPYLGAGNAPDDWGLNVMLRPGEVSDGAQIKLPATRNRVFAVPPNCADGFFIWLESTVNADGVMESLDYNCGTTLPTAVTPAINADGTPPPTTCDLLLILTSSATAVDLSAAGVQQIRSTALTLRPVVTGVGTNGSSQRRMFWQGDAAVGS